MMLEPLRLRICFTQISADFSRRKGADLCCVYFNLNSYAPSADSFQIQYCGLPSRISCSSFGDSPAFHGRVR